MWKKIKSLFKSTAFNILLIFGLTILVLYVSMKDDGGQVLDTLKNVNIWWLVGIIIMMVFEAIICSAGDLVWNAGSRIQNIRPCRASLIRTLPVFSATSHQGLPAARLRRDTSSESRAFLYPTSISAMA